LEAAGIDGALLPPIQRPGTVVGVLSTSAAEATGLAAGTPLIVGGADHVMSAYSAGVSAPGQALVKLGSSGDLLAVSSTPLTDWRLYLDRHPIPDLWIPNGCMATSGSLLRWFQQQLAGGSDFRELDAAGATIAAGSDGVICLPYFLGEKSPIHDPEARGAFVGLHLGHTQAHLFRACLESTGYGLRHHLDILNELGVSVNEIRVTNGGANSALWKQVVADALELPLTPVVDHPGGSLGAAIAAAVGVGLIEQWTDVDRFVRLGAPIEPDASARAAMELGYGVYRDLEAVLRPLSHRLARA
jgi:xylulokinase